MNNIFNGVLFFNYADYILSRHYAVLYVIKKHTKKNWQLNVFKVYSDLIDLFDR